MKKANVIRGVSFGALAASALPALAEVDAAVTTELAGVKTDMLTVGGLIIALAAASLGIRWVKATFF